MRTRHAPLCLLLGLGALAACATLPVPVPGPQVPGPTPAPASAAAEVVSLTNDARTRNGRRVLATSSRLMEAARLHAGQMAAHQQAAHTISGARHPTMQSRLDAVGYAYASAAENVAWNQRSAQEVVTTWLNSSGHRANMLDAGFTEMGAAVAYSARGEPYWIQVFGRPR